MREYFYTAKNADGEYLKGTVEAESQSAAAKLLSKRDVFAITISEKESFSFFLFNRVPYKDKVFLIRQLSTTINAGLPISQALQTLITQTSSSKLKEILTQVCRDVEGGSTLSNAFARFPNFFSSIDVTLIAAGEASGTLDKVLTRLATTIENDYKIRKKIKSAMIYPIFVLSVIGMVLVVMNMYVLPKMESLYSSFNGAQLPLITRQMMAMSHFFSRFWYLVIASIIGFAFLFRWLINTDGGRYIWDKTKVHTPPFNKFLINVYMSRFTRTMAGLIGSGVSLIDSLKIVSGAVGNKVISDEIKKYITKVKSGVPLSTPLKASEYFPPIVSQMVNIGEQTGELDNMLSNLADYFDEEVDGFVKGITSVIEPFIIVALALIVGFILVAIMLPIYQFGKIV